MKTYKVLAKLLHQLVPGGRDLTPPILAAFVALPIALQKMKPAIQSTLLYLYPSYLPKHRSKKKG